MRIAPLGGLGEIGLNSMWIEEGEDALLIDAGVMFGTDEMPGIGQVLPDFTHVLENAAKLRAIVLTHGHEDHIGALGDLLRKLRVPVYGAPFTLALVRHRLEEDGIDAELRELSPRESFRLGSLSVEPVRVCHSVPDAMGVVVRSPTALVIHTGDYKIDPTPPDGSSTDLERLGQLGDEGVDCLLADSTNSEVTHSTRSEREVAERLEQIIVGAPGRVVVSMFASNLERIGQLVRACARSGRKVALLGRGMLRNVDLAQKLGRLADAASTLISIDDAQSRPAREVCLLATGAQGEPRSALWQLLSDERGPRIHAGDVVVLSSRTIPGNERPVARLIDTLAARGARVIHSEIDPGVHASGHASPDQQKELIARIRPKALVPIHGEPRQLRAQLLTAAELLPPGALLSAHDGDLIEVDEGGARRVGQVRSGRRHRDAFGRGIVSPERMQERRRLAETGAVFVTALLEPRTLEPRAPIVVSSGLAAEEDALLPAASAAAREAISALSAPMRADDALVRDEVVQAVRRVFKQSTGKRPAVIPVIVKL